MIRGAGRVDEALADRFTQFIEQADESDCMRRILYYTVTREEAGLRVDQYLKRRGYSRQILTELKKFAGSVSVDGEEYYMNRRLNAGGRMKVILTEEPKQQKIIPEKLPLAVVYEDEDILVVNKPAGMPTHPSMNHDRNTLAGAVVFYYREGDGARGRKAREGEADFVFRCGNRLDRDTSGLTVIAKNMLAAAVLASMTASGRMHRQYLGIVRGSLVPEEGTIDAPLGRRPGSVIERMIDREGGERAVTHYRKLAEKNGHSLVLMELETGRTHQIRIHMKSIGYPLIGDYLYNPDMEYIGRQALHSARLCFPHPVTGEEMRFTAALPEDMRRVLEVRPEMDS